MKKLEATNFENGQFLDYDCPFVTTIRFLGKRWKPAVVWKIENGAVRYAQLKEKMPFISDKMLASTLTELEADGIIQKKVMSETPVRIEYSLTEFGKTLNPMLDEMLKWGSKTNKDLKRDFCNEE